MNNNQGLISIIVPVYKVEQFLSRCVESLFAQSYKNIEVILIDDDSPDNCPQLCDNYSKDFERITTIHLKDSGFGVSGARNAGIENAKGEYITFVDSDDFAHKELLSTLKKALDSDPEISMSICSYQKVTDNTELIYPIQTDDFKLINNVEAMDLLIEDQHMSAVWGKLYKRTIFDNLRFPIGKFSEDIFLMPFILQNAKKIAFTPSPLYYYYQDNDSLCRAKFNYHMLDQLDALAVWKEHVAINCPNLLDKVNAHFFSSVINICQYLAIKKDEYGMNKFTYYKSKINSDFKYIILSEYISTNNKVKTMLLKTGLFLPFFKLISFLNIKKYE